jgi:hypothetical protein
MFKCENNMGFSVVSTAVDEANSIHSAGQIYRLIGEHRAYDMSTALPEYISIKLCNFIMNNDINIKIYKPKWRWSKAYGYFSPANPHDINLNYYKLNRSVSSIVGTLYHEATHQCDNEDKIHSYGHGDNSPKGKANTAPYFIGNVASGLFKTNYDMNNTQDSTYKLYVPWYKRLWGRIKKWIF